MSKIILIVLVAVLATAFAYPAYLDAEEQAVPMVRVVREANPEPRHHGVGGFGAIGGLGGYGGGYPYGGLGGYGGGYGGGFPHGGYGGYGGYGGLGGGLSHSSAHAGSINTPFGSGSFASANAGSLGYGR